MSTRAAFRNITCLRRQQQRTVSTSLPRDSIERLQAAFRDHTSPFYLEPGSQGPSSPGDGFVIPEQVYTLHHEEQSAKLHTNAGASESLASGSALSASLEEGRSQLSEQGYDPKSFFEQKVVWGDMDAFRHVNNVRYIRYLESARIHWMRSLAIDLGGEEKAKDMITGKGVSLILGELSIKFRRPVVYPDTLLVAHKPHTPFPTHFKCAAAIWSAEQQAVVATSDSTLVWYNYDVLKKCDPGPEAHAILHQRIQP